MIRRRDLLAVFLSAAAVVMLVAGGAMGNENGKANTAPARAAMNTQDQESTRIEGEKRFHANCGRCHQAPHKFPPRMMATIVRHMRVRATITDQDMRVILQYMTQ